jgi:hypothetical protein
MNSEKSLLLYLSDERLEYPSGRSIVVICAVLCAEGGASPCEHCISYKTQYWVPYLCQAGAGNRFPCPVGTAERANVAHPQ